MTYITKPTLHHPKLPANSLGFTRCDYEGAVSTLCAGCGHDFDQRRHHPGLLRAGIAAAPYRQVVRHWLFFEDALLIPWQFPWLQQRPRPHALGADSNAN